MAKKLQRTNSVTIKLNPEEKFSWELKAHATGLSISQLGIEAVAKVKIYQSSNDTFITPPPYKTLTPGWKCHGQPCSPME